jgi:hypothetical protein
LLAGKVACAGTIPAIVTTSAAPLIDSIVRIDLFIISSPLARMDA